MPVDIITTPATPMGPTPSSSSSSFSSLSPPKNALTAAAVSSLSSTTAPLSKSSFSGGLAIPHRPQSPDTLSLISADDFSELRLGRVGSRGDRRVAAEERARDAEKYHAGDRGFKAKCAKSWKRNKGLAFVLLAQVFGTLMNVTTRMLETGSENAPGMNPFQILFFRMGITFALCMLYMWWTNVEHWPLGAKEVRVLLLARGVGGFFGVFGLYWSLQYLPLADATVLTFLAPTISCFICSKLIKEPFTRVEQIGAFVSLAGVVLIARPTSMFSTSPTPADDSDSSDNIPHATPHQHLAAVGMAMVGVCGAACAYTTIRWIGQRAHPLVSVNYFSCWCTIVSAVALAVVPSVPFELPATRRQWGLLFFIGVTGFVMQFLLTAGLRYEKSSRATNMVFSQMIFALAFDKLIWGTTPGALSIVGSSLILGAAIVVAVQKEKSKDVAGDGEHRDNGDEEAGLMTAAYVEGGPEAGEAVEMDEQGAGCAEDARTRDQR